MTNDEWRREAHAAANALRADIESMEFDLSVMSIDMVLQTWAEVQERIETLQRAMERN